MEQPRKEIEFEVVKDIPTRDDIMHDVSNLTKKVIRLIMHDEVSGGEDDPILTCLADMLVLFGSAVTSQNKEVMTLLSLTMATLFMRTESSLRKSLGEEE